MSPYPSHAPRAALAAVAAFLAAVTIGLAVVLPAEHALAAAPLTAAKAFEVAVAAARESFVFRTR